MVTIKKASKNDSTAIKEVLFNTWKDTYINILSEPVINRVSEQLHSIDRLQQQIDDPSLYFAVAKDYNHTVMGLSTASQKHNTIYISKLYVSPKHQRLGIGDRLLNTITTHFSSAHKIALEVVAHNDKGINFYERKGFKASGKRDDQIDQYTFPVLKMEKILKKAS